MAARYWVGDTDGLWNKADNWGSTSGGAGGAGVPTSADAVIFDSGYTTQNCTCDVAIDIGSINVQSTYDGKLDFADSAYGHASAGDMIFDGSGEVDCGDSTITCSGNFDNKDQTTWTRGTSTIVMNGSAKTIIGHTLKDLHNLTISDDTTLSATTVSRLPVQGLLLVDATKTFTLLDTLLMQGTVTINGIVDAQAFFWTEGASVAIPGELSGTSSWLLFQFTTVTDATGTITIATINATRNMTLAPGTYGNSSTVTTFKQNANSSRTVTFLTGIFIFPGDVTFDADQPANTYFIDCDTNSVDIEFQSDLTITESSTSTLSWTKSNSATAIKFSGTTTYTDTTAAIQNIGDVEVDGTSLTLATELECDDFDGTSGTLDTNGQDLISNGNMDWASGFVIADPAASTIAPSGNFTGDGQDLSASGEWFFNVGGTAVVLGTGDVANSNASGGNEIDASAGPANNLGGNTNWDFGVVAGTILPQMMQYLYG